MRIFLTGASGYIGSAILDALVRGGHQVTALVRDQEKAKRVSSRGGKAVIATLAEPESYRAAADAQDGYIHTAYDSTPGRGRQVDQATIETLLAAARRPRTVSPSTPQVRFFIYTSCASVLGRMPEPVAEDAAVNPIALVAWRPGHEAAVLAADAPTLRTLVVRPGVVYGSGAGVVGDLFRSAANGIVRVIGDGNNHWPLIYDRDLADLYLRLAQHDAARGVFHANDEGDERVIDIVSAISPHLPHTPDIRCVPLEEAKTTMGDHAEAQALDQMVRSPRARALGWAPTLHSVAGNAARLLGEWRAARA